MFSSYPSVFSRDNGFGFRQHKSNNCYDFFFFASYCSLLNFHKSKASIPKQTGTIMSRGFTHIKKKIVTKFFYAHAYNIQSFTKRCQVIYFLIYFSDNTLFSHPSSLFVVKFIVICFQIINKEKDYK